MKLAAWLCLGLLCLEMTACAASPAYSTPLTTGQPPAENTPAEFNPEPDQKQTITLAEPPVLTVTAGTVSIKATRGTTSWSYDSGDGTWSDMKADGIVPLDETSLQFLPRLRYEGRAATLSFAVEPETVELTCWHAVHWGNTGAAGQTLSVEGGAFTLALGPGIYEVKAQWSGADTYSGTAYYSFYAAPVEEAPLVTVESGGMAVAPYPFQTWSEVWTENGQFCTDRPWIDTELPRLAEAGEIPNLTFSGFLTYEQQDTVTVSRLLLFDAQYEALEDPTWESLANLSPGSYYIGIEAAVLLQFVSSVESYDCAGYVFVFQLTVV